ncbi:MAG: GAF domain-containing protein, partial [Anaerolineae bacterium]|nr:GAF domain-containing protein [Anaerolineae bacterium]
MPNPTLPGAQSWLLLQFSMIKADKGPVGVLCTVEDQTAVRESQHQLQTANQSLEQFAYRTTLLNDIVQTGISDLDVETILQRFADRLGDLFLSNGCYLTLWDANQKKVLPGAAFGPMRQIYPDIPLLPDKPTVTEAVLESGNYLIVDDLVNSPFAHFHQVSTFSGTSMLAVPLIAGSQKLGAILIIFSEDHLFSPSEIDLGEQAANQIAWLLPNALLEREREQRQLAVALQEIGTLLSATMDSEAVLDMTLAQIQRVVPYDTANISLLERGEIHLSRSQGYESFTSALPDQVEGRPFSLETVAAFRQIAETRQPLCLPDTRQFEGWVVTPATRHVRSWIGVPLLIGEEIIGFLCVDKIQPGFYDESHKQHLAALAYQVTLALQHAQLFAESQRQAQRLTILNDLAAQMAALVTVQELTDLVVEKLYEDFDYDNVAVFMIDPDDREDLVLSSIVGAYAFIALETHGLLHVGEGVIGQAALTGHYVLANDTAVHPNFFQPPGFNTRAELAVPIKVDQTVLGVLNIDSYQSFVFDQADVSLLLIVTEHLAVAIHKARLFELTHKRAQELEILSVVSAQLRAAHAVSDMLPIVLENIVQAVHATVGVIYLKDEGGEQVVSRAVYPEGGYMLGLCHKLGQGITGYVAQTGQVYVSANLQEDTRLYLQDEETIYLHELTSAIALPLQNEDFIVGVVHIGFDQVHHFSMAERQLLSSLTDIAANALYRAQVMESLEVRVEERTQALRQANDRLQELDRLKSKFISDVTHELRTPVANMNLYLDLLRMGRPEKHQHYMSVIENQTARLTEIVQTTMQVPELGTMTAPEELEEVILVDVVQTAVSLYAARA